MIHSSLHGGGLAAAWCIIINMLQQALHDLINRRQCWVDAMQVIYPGQALMLQDTLYGVICSSFSDSDIVDSL